MLQAKNLAEATKRNYNVDAERPALTLFCDDFYAKQQKETTTSAVSILTPFSLSLSSITSKSAACVTPFSLSLIHI